MREASNKYGVRHGSPYWRVLEAERNEFRARMLKRQREHRDSTLSWLWDEYLSHWKVYYIWQFCVSFLFFITYYIQVSTHREFCVHKEVGGTRYEI